MSIATSADQHFTSDSVAIRATWRIGANLVRPNRVTQVLINDLLPGVKTTRSTSAK